MSRIEKEVTLPHSRTARALIASTAGLVGAGSVVCAALAFTHAAHRSPHVASLAPVSAAADAPPGRGGAAGLLSWQPPAMPGPLSLPPRVVTPVRVVVVTRVIHGSTPTRRTTSSAKPARRVAATTPTTATRTTSASTRRPATRTVSDDEHGSQDDDRDGETQHDDRQRDGSDEHERDDDE